MSTNSPSSSSDAVPRIQDFPPPNVFSGDTADFPAHALRLDQTMRSVIMHGPKDMAKYLSTFSDPADKTRASFVLYAFIMKSLPDDVMIQFANTLQQDNTASDPVALWTHLSTTYGTSASVHNPPLPLMQELLAARVHSPSQLMEHLTMMRSLWSRFQRADNVGALDIGLFVSLLIGSLSECHPLESLRRDLGKFTGPSPASCTQAVITETCRIAIEALTSASSPSNFALSVTAGGPCARCEHPHCPAPAATECLAFQCLRCNVFGHTSDRCVKCPTCNIQGHVCIKGTKMYPKFRTGKNSNKPATDPSELSPAKGKSFTRPPLGLAVLDPAIMNNATSSLSKSENHHQSSDRPLSYRDAAARAIGRTPTRRARTVGTLSTPGAPSRPSTRTPTKQRGAPAGSVGTSPKLGRAVETPTDPQAVETPSPRSALLTRALATAAASVPPTVPPDVRTTHTVTPRVVSASPGASLHTPDFSGHDITIPLKSNDSISSFDFAGTATTQQPLSTSTAVTTVVYDTGAMRHVLNDSSLFVEWLPSPETIRGVHGHMVECRVGHAHVRVAAVDAAGHPCEVSLFLRDVVYQPDGPCNLISAYLLRKEGFQPAAGLSSLLAPNGDSIPMQWQDRVAIFFVSPLPGAGVSNVLLAASASADIWHSRYMHRAVPLAAQLNALPGCDLFGVQDHKGCTTCTLANITNHHPGPSNSDRLPKEPLELVVSDVMGPISPTAHIGGERYIISFVDAYTGHVALYVTPRKNAVPAAFQRYLSLVPRTPARFRCDGGGEYINDQFDRLLLDHQITLETTAPASSHQNGTAERWNRTCAGMIRAALIHAKLPLHFWPFAAQHTAYVHNRTLPPRRVDSQLTRYELVFNKPPSTTHLATFGCKTIYHVVEPQGKLEPRGRLAIYLGKPHDSAGFLLYDVNDHRVLVRNQIRFFEDVPGGSLLVPTPTPPQLFPLPPHQQQNQAPPVAPSPGPSQHAPDSPFEPSSDSADSSSSPSHQLDSDSSSCSVASDDAVSSSYHDHILSPSSSSMDDSSSSPASSGSSPPQPRYPTRTRNPPPVVYAPDAANLVYAEADKGTTDPNSPDYIPKSYKDAMSCKFAKEWMDAMTAEMAAHTARGTSEVVPLPPDAKPLPSHWIFAVKYSADNTIERRKARWVANGDRQVFGVNYFHTYAGTMTFTSFRVLLAVAAHFGYQLKQVDVKTAFLYAPMDDDVFVFPPQGFPLPRPRNGPRLVHRLCQALYGTRQAGRAWIRYLTRFLLAHGFTQSTADPCIFVGQPSHFQGYFVLGVWVDDMLVIFALDDDWNKFINIITDTFQVRHGDAHLFLGMVISRLDDGSFRISHENYITDIVSKFSLSDMNPVKAPMPAHLSHDDAHPVPGVAQEPHFPYRQLLGSLLYLAVTTRPDIAHAVIYLAPFSANPSKVHTNALRRVLAYLNTTKDHTLHFRRGDSHAANQLLAYADSDLAGDVSTSRSVSGRIIYLNTSPISWSSRKQTKVALSTTEAEAYALVEAIKDVTNLRILLSDLGFPQSGPTPLHCDNRGAVLLADKPLPQGRSRHFRMATHYIQENNNNRVVDVVHVPSTQQLADGFTKPLPAPAFAVFAGPLLSKPSDC